MRDVCERDENFGVYGGFRIQAAGDNRNRGSQCHRIRGAELHSFRDSAGVIESRIFRGSSKVPE